MTSPTSHLSDPDHRPRILLCVLGTTPQLVTELLWFYGNPHRREPFHFDEVHIISTERGHETAAKTLLPINQGPVAEVLDAGRMAMDRTRMDASTFHCHTEDADFGTPMTDVRTPQDANRCTHEIEQLVRSLKQREPDPILYASVAGGRKTQGIALTLAMQIHGGPEDRLIHVLVQPPAFENCPDFFFPKQSKRRIFGRSDPEHENPLDPADAQIEVAEIPFLRLRSLLTAHFGDEIPGYGQIVRSLQRTIDASIIAPPVTVDVAAGSILWGNRRISGLTPRLMAIYAFYLQLRSSHSSHAQHDPVGCPECFVPDRPEDRWPEEHRIRLNELSGWTGVRRKHSDLDPPTTDVWAIRATPNAFSNARRGIREALAAEGDEVLQALDVARVRIGAEACYGSALAPERIRFERT